MSPSTHVWFSLGMLHSTTLDIANYLLSNVVVAVWELSFPSIQHLLCFYSANFRGMRPDLVSIYLSTSEVEHLSLIYWYFWSILTYLLYLFSFSHWFIGINYVYYRIIMSVYMCYTFVLPVYGWFLKKITYTVICSMQIFNFNCPVLFVFLFVLCI